MEELPLLEIRPNIKSMMLFYVVGFVGTALVFWPFFIIFFAVFSWSSFSSLFGVFLVLMVLLFFSSLRTAKRTHITFFSDKVAYWHLLRRGEDRVAERGELSFDQITEVRVSRMPTDWLLGTGAIRLYTTESKNRWFWMTKVPTVRYVKDPFAVRAEIDRVLASKTL